MLQDGDPSDDESDSDSDSSSEGSSGWESSDGDSSSVNTTSVEFFDPKMSNLGNPTMSAGYTNRNSLDDQLDELYDQSMMMNRGINPALQRVSDCKSFFC